jgi:hypothetical protein
VLEAITPRASPVVSIDSCNNFFIVVSLYASSN